MKMIDLHCHFNIGSPFDYAESNIHKGSFEFIMKSHEKFGIGAGAFSPFSSVCEAGVGGIYDDNEYLFKLANTNEKIYQWVVLDPRQEKLFPQVKEMLNNDKVLGIKIHSAYHKYDIEEYADRIFSFADEHSAFVLMHPDKISAMVKYADKYPNMKLIIAHLGTESHIAAIKQAKNGNIFTDTSGGASNLNNIIEYAVSEVGSEKIFFGTDTYACSFQIARIQYADISDADKENIFYKNAERYFKLGRI